MDPAHLLQLALNPDPLGLGPSSDDHAGPGGESVRARRRNSHDGQRTPRRPEHVVVVGGGFGGLALARRLGRASTRGAPVRVTLLDRRNHHTFQPLLYQVATAGLRPQDIGVPLRATLRRQGVDVRLGDVVAIDADRRRLQLAEGSSLGYDRLVIAAGAVTADFGVPGVADHAFALKSLADATTLRNHILRRFEEATATPVRADDGTLTFVIVGGGPGGVELAGALAELVDLVVRHDHPELDVTRIRIVLIERRERLLGTFSERSGRAALHGLRRRGVDVRLETGVVNVTSDHVELSDGETLATRTVVWFAGVSASPLARSLGVPLSRGGRIPVDEHLRVEGLPEVYAIGDVAASSGADGRLLPQVAPVAIQQGRYVARHVLDVAVGRKTAPFRYRDKGSMATIGRASAVVELPGPLYLGGLVAWFAWLLLHLVQLVGFKNRTSVLGSWLWNYLTYDHAARVIVDQREAAAAEPTLARRSSVPPEVGHAAPDEALGRTAQAR